MKWQIGKWELGVLVALIVLFQFLTTNYNSNLGNLYSIFTIGAVLYIIIDPQRDIQFKKESNSFLTSVFVAGVAVVGFLLLGSYVLIPGTKGLLNLLASSTPILANNPLTNKIVFGILVAITETLVWVYLMDLIASMANIRVDKSNLKSLKLWSIIIGLSLLFLVFHLTAKMTGNMASDSATLVVVFFMMVISLLLAVFRKQALDAVLFHVILNSLAIGLISL